jgi:hypothetical protein
VQLSRVAPVFQRLDLGLARTVQFHINPFQHGVQISADLRIPEPDNTVSFFFEPKLPSLIAPGCFVFVVMPAIEFDNQMSGWTEEVDDVGTDRRLTSKVCAGYGEFLQGAP